MGTTKTDVYTAEQLRLAELFRALGHPARVAILQQIMRAGCCICRDFSDEIDLAQPTISRHLRELKSAGLIAGTVAGNRVSYCIDPARWTEVRQVLGKMFPGASECC